MIWLDEFKSALVGEDLNKIEKLIQNYPPKMSADELECLSELLKAASELYHRKMKELEGEFIKVKKARKYDF